MVHCIEGHSFVLVCDCCLFKKHLTHLHLYTRRLTSVSEHTQAFFSVRANALAIYNLVINIYNIAIKIPMITTARAARKSMFSSSSSLEDGVIIIYMYMWWGFSLFRRGKSVR